MRHCQKCKVNTYHTNSSSPVDLLNLGYSNCHFENSFLSWKLLGRWLHLRPYMLSPLPLASGWSPTARSVAQRLPSVAGSSSGGFPQLLPGYAIDEISTISDIPGQAWPRAGDTEIHYDPMAAEEPVWTNRNGFWRAWHIFTASFYHHEHTQPLLRSASCYLNWVGCETQRFNDGFDAPWLVSKVGVRNIRLCPQWLAISYEMLDMFSPPSSVSGRPEQLLSTIPWWFFVVSALSFLHVCTLADWLCHLENPFHAGHTWIMLLSKRITVAPGSSN